MAAINLALIICNKGSDQDKLVASVLTCGLTPICCSNLKEARFLLPQTDFKMVLCNEALKDGDFRSVLREAHTSDANMPVIVFGRSCGWDSYLSTIGAGAYDYIVCPPNPIEVEKVIWAALANTTAPKQRPRIHSTPKADPPKSAAFCFSTVPSACVLHRSVACLRESLKAQPGSSSDLAGKLFALNRQAPRNAGGSSLLRDATARNPAHGVRPPQTRHESPAGDRDMVPAS